LLLHPSNFLLLDEPTNHLDMRAKDVLLEALAKYTGTVVFVSHDRYFIDRLATRVFEVGDGRVEVYPGNYEDYAWRKQGGAVAAAVPTLEDVPGWKSRNAHGKGESGNGRRASKTESVVAGEATNGNDGDEAKAKRLNPIKRKQMEGRVHEIEKDIARVEGAIAHHETALLTFVSAEETQRVSRELDARRKELAALMEEWEELSSSLDGAS
jgi:ATP-binding cassette, subfamily F, member 3